MNTSLQIANHFRQVHFGGNWTSVNLKDTLADVDWQQATTKIQSLNTIAVLVFHMNYYTSEVLKVLNGELLSAHDKFSFAMPLVNSREDWEKLLGKTWADAERFADLVEKIPETKLWENFSNEKYGTYFRNLSGIIEHMHYHLGQIALIKKLLEKK